jgi:pyruvate formate lyase activating enzyme
MANFIAGFDRDIPYALLAFHPNFEMSELRAMSRQRATECLEAAKAAGLTRVRIGNLHLLN